MNSCKKKHICSRHCAACREQCAAAAQELTALRADTAAIVQRRTQALHELQVRVQGIISCKCHVASTLLLGLYLSGRLTSDVLCGLACYWSRASCDSEKSVHDLLVHPQERAEAAQAAAAAAAQVLVTACNALRQ